MAIAQNAQLTNIWKSFKKFLVDNLKQTEGIRLTFDKGVSFNDQNTIKWIDATLLGSNTKQISYQDVRLICATRKDNDGDELLALRDILFKYLTDPQNTSGFLTRHVTLYNTSDINNLIEIGTMMILFPPKPESGIFTADDRTKYKVINIMLYFESNI